MDGNSIFIQSERSLADLVIKTVDVAIDLSLKHLYFLLLTILDILNLLFHE